MKDCDIHTVVSQPVSRSVNFHHVKISRLQHLIVYNLQIQYTNHIVIRICVHIMMTEYQTEYRDLPYVKFRWKYQAYMERWEI